MNKILSGITIFLYILSGISYAQNKDVVQEAFLPFKTGPGNEYRTGGGKPGEDYWQNEADYDIDANLDTENHILTATETIHYTNNSPDDLGFLWLQMDQNLFSKDSRGARITPYRGSRFGNSDFDGGFTIKSISVLYNGRMYQPKTRLVDTNMKIELKNPVKAHKGKIDVKIEYQFHIPKYGSDRMGRVETQNGWVYQIAQWYPRLAVYDDIEGWNVLPYLGAGEFYLEYGNFDVKITAPYNQVVLSSGKLMNPDDVWTSTQLDSLEKARNSNQTVMIIGENQVGTDGVRPKNNGTLTWHYTLNNARDFAFGSSKAFIVDAARINLPDGDHILGMSAYPAESAGQNAWSRSTEYVKGAIEYYSQKWFKFPWPKAVNIAGVVAGMEYPGLAFCSWHSQGRGLWGVTTHELGHSWFPMIVGSNERQYAWMDEGFNTFINQYSTMHFNDGEYFYGLSSPNGIINFLQSSRNEAIMTYPDQIQRGNLGTVAYYKPSMGLQLLREVILGPDRFDEAFRTYVHRWAFKHPTPNDFFNTMEDVSGENLDWFWRGWFEKTWKLDQAVDSVSYVQNDPSKGALVHIRNLDKMVMPVTMEVEQQDGKKMTVHLPVEVWERGNTWISKLDTDSPIKSVVIDPDNELPDVNGVNNVWTATPADSESRSN